MLVKVDKVAGILCAKLMTFRPKSINGRSILIIFTSKYEADVPLSVPDGHTIREKAGMGNPPDSHADFVANKRSGFVESFVHQAADHRVQLGAIFQIQSIAYDTSDT